MRVFLQISISGFKIFDPEKFTHDCEKGKFAQMSDINSTQNGETGYRTHITKMDDHGIPFTISQLFSSPFVDYLLQNAMFDGCAKRMFYVSRNGFTLDSQNRLCDMSLLFVSDEEDAEIVNKVAYLICVENDPYILETMPKVLCKDIVDSQLVLMYNKGVFGEMIEYVKGKKIENPGMPNLNALLNGNNQLLVFGDNSTLDDVVTNMVDTFNCEPYWCFSSKHLPVNKHKLSVPDELHTLKNRVGTIKSYDSDDNFFDGIIKSLNGLFNKH